MVVQSDKGGRRESREIDPRIVSSLVITQRIDSSVTFQSPRVRYVTILAVSTRSDCQPARLTATDGRPFR